MRQPNGRFAITQHIIYTHWTTYFAWFGGGILLALLAIVVSAPQGWWGFVLLAFAMMLLLGGVLVGHFYYLSQLYDTPGPRIADYLFDLGQFQETTRFVHLGLGLRRTAIALGRKLTTGHITVVDVHNPQLTPSRAIIRVRRDNILPLSDPRFTWQDGNIDMLPMADEQITAVTIDQVVLEFSQMGDREQLLREVYRILVPGGRLLLAEKVRTPAYWLMRGPLALLLPTSDEWIALLHHAGFVVKRHFILKEQVICLRADKPIPVAGQQLTLGLDIS